MDGTPKDERRLTLRVSDELYRRIERLAQGSKKRPAAKINPTIVWLLEQALEQAEKSEGQYRPKILRAA